MVLKVIPKNGSDSGGKVSGLVTVHNGMVTGRPGALDPNATAMYQTGETLSVEIQKEAQN